jgi:hypothetical protein
MTIGLCAKDPKWPINFISGARRIVLRTCVHEIEFCDDGQCPATVRVDLPRDLDRLRRRDVRVGR